MARKKKRVPVARGEKNGCKLHLSDEIQRRLRLTAVDEKVTQSQIAEEIFDKHLPRFEFRRVG